MAKIRITFGKENGTVTSEINGMKGSKCTSVDSFLSELGAVKQKLSSEYYDDAQSNEVQINTQQS